MGKYVDEAGLTRVVNKTKDMVAASQKVATSSTPGIVKPDGANISVTSDGTISLSDGGVTEAKLSEDVKTKLNNGGSVTDGSITFSKFANPMTQDNTYVWDLNGNDIRYKNGTMKLEDRLSLEAYESGIDMDAKSSFINNGYSSFKGPTNFNDQTTFNGESYFQQNATFNALLDVSNGGINLPSNSVTTEKLADASVTKAKLASDISIPDIEYSQTDLEAGISELAAGKLYFVYE